MNGSILATATAALEGIEREGLTKHERSILSPQGSHIAVEGMRPGVEIINLCANNYLGLADDPRLVEAAQEALDRYGFGMASVRFICGTQDVHKRARGAARRLPRHRGRDPLFAPASTPMAGCSRRCSARRMRSSRDALNHASHHRRHPAVQGQALPLSPTTTWPIWRRSCEGAREDARFRLIATDGVFSMDGIIANLRGDLRSRRALRCDGDGRRLAMPSASSGRAGAARRSTAASRAGSTSSPARSARRWAARPAAIRPGGGRSSSCCASARGPICSPTRWRRSIAAASLKALDLLAVEGGELRQRLCRQRAALPRGDGGSSGFTLVPGEHPIIPVMLGDAELAPGMAARLLRAGHLCDRLLLPGRAARARRASAPRCRAAHTASRLDRAIAAFAERPGASSGCIR